MTNIRGDLTAAYQALRDAQIEIRARLSNENPQWSEAQVKANADVILKDDPATKVYDELAIEAAASEYDQEQELFTSQKAAADAVVEGWKRQNTQSNAGALAYASD